MPDIYVKAKKTFVRNEQGYPQEFVEGRFYQVDSVTDSVIRVAHGDMQVPFSTQESADLFERMKGDFKSLVADRPVFKILALALADLLQYHTGCFEDDFMAYATAAAEIKESLVELFLYDKYPQPDTSVTGWQFALIKDGKSQYFFETLLKTIGINGAELEHPFITVSVEFESDELFTLEHTVTRKIKHRLIRKGESVNPEQ